MSRDERTGRDGEMRVDVECHYDLEDVANNVAACCLSPNLHGRTHRDTRLANPPSLRSTGQGLQMHRPTLLGGRPPFEPQMLLTAIHPSLCPVGVKLQTLCEPSPLPTPTVQPQPIPTFDTSLFRLFPSRLVLLCRTLLPSHPPSLTNVQRGCHSYCGTAAPLAIT